MHTLHALLIGLCIIVLIAWRVWQEAGNGQFLWLNKNMMKWRETDKCWHMMGTEDGTFLHCGDNGRTNQLSVELTLGFDDILHVAVVWGKFINLHSKFHQWKPRQRQSGVSSALISLSSQTKSDDTYEVEYKMIPHQTTTVIWCGTDWWAGMFSLVFAP